MYRKNVLIGLAAAVAFSILFGTGLLDRLEDQIYDLLLRFRPDRELSSEVVFLDVDDNAIAYAGEFPWPRSITADALVRLKEYGARAAIFDIEYIDRGPQGVDAIYLNQGLSDDFNRSFTEINSTSNDVFQAIRSALRFGRISQAEIDEYSLGFSEIIRDAQTTLFQRSRRIARDNDLYLFQCSALFGKSWATLNLRDETQPLDEEQSSRRPLAEELFSYPVIALDRAYKGEYVDILPCLPDFGRAALGAGFTNVQIDEDGVRRRIDLAQNIHDHWYLQLAFAPLVHYLGSPEIELDNRKMLVKNAEMPDGETRDISIPLDGKGRMLLDWPKKDYVQSYTHISFHEFILLENIEADLERYSRGLSEIDFFLFSQFDPSLARLPFIIMSLNELVEAVRDYRDAAIEQRSDEYFNNLVDYRSQSRELIQEILDMEAGAKINALLPYLLENHPELTDYFNEEAEYVESVMNDIALNLEKYIGIKDRIESTVKDRFCILGRTDTGTTDYGANPFHGKYINVGTHGVVLDMILSENFIYPIGFQWHVAFTLVFVCLFFLLSSKLPPVPRAVSGFFMIGLVALASAMLFRLTGMYFSPLLTVFAMVTAVIVREIMAYAGSEREKQFIRKAFSTYVSDDVVKEIISDPSRLQLGGTKRHMSAIFTDIRGFSTISEQLDPEGLVSLLNRYLTVMSDAILGERGTIDKYEGDAIIAFFGAPMDLPDHALRACCSAINMKRIEQELNDKVLEEKLSPLPLYTRIGINTGSMVAGNMGTGNKMNYTIMGNAVNLAARLEGVNKQYGTKILTTFDTFQETGNQILARKIDRVRVVGINEPVQLLEVLNTVEQAEEREKKLVEVFHQAMDFYVDRNWKDAMDGFNESLVLEDDGKGPSSIYFNRCKNYFRYPPPDDWDGVTNMTEK